MNKNKIISIASIVVALVIVIGAIWYVSSKQSPNGDGNGMSSAGLSISGLQKIGSENAPFTILEFGDFQCVACAQLFASIMPKVKTEFIDTGKANMVYKTLTFIDGYANKMGNGESWLSAQAVECSTEQGKFWDMYDAIFNAEVEELSKGTQNENSGNLTRKFMIESAQKIGMDKDKFSSCLDNQKYTKNIEGYDKDMRDAGITGTPSVFIIKKGGEATKLTNPFDLTEYEKIIR